VTIFLGLFYVSVDMNRDAIHGANLNWSEAQKQRRELFLGQSDIQISISGIQKDMAIVQEDVRDLKGEIKTLSKR